MLNQYKEQHTFLGDEEENSESNDKKEDQD